ncbi:Thermostable carboxypeptidase 1 [Patulibacter medicamentivorans]|uniref:Metal-dependent carboxypeptidase n=1 Tax=Patulibacter medicamentivorans TaxID=1097667 RepID=H0E236_9ACTN|nr:carboxypeptidase M32 [Patulibacter medicamentivorans]EHN12246.1 Thermostable carboxypeptidase 1 [Patulibacter medicamentivorans]
MSADDPRAALRERLRELDDLQHASRVLGWDQQVAMPAAGTAARGRAGGTVERLAHERLTDPELGSLLDAAEAAGEDPGVIRAVRRDHERARRVPGELVAEIAQAAADAQPVWQKARETSDFALFAPALKRNLELRRRVAACFPEAAHPYDALLDQFEPEMTTAEVRSVFDRLQAGLRPLIAAIAGKPLPDPLGGVYPVDAQRTLSLEIGRTIGFDDESWRLDVSTHPFSQKVGPGDVRVTTRYDEADPLSGLLSTLHEVGHGLYEFQVDPALAGTTADTGTSLGIHESQSRLWENQVGRSRAFWAHWYPRAQELFGDALAGVDLDAFLRAVNVVRPSLIRVEADEVTYAMHIVLRFELEVAMLEGSLEVDDLPAAWNARMSELLGVDVPDDAHGVLQDIHWSFGELGYFPTYALGSIISAQLWEAAGAAIPDLEGAISRGDAAPLRAWLGENVHRHGRTRTTDEILRATTGGPLDPDPLVRYLTTKFGALYGLVPS